MLALPLQTLSHIAVQFAKAVSSLVRAFHLDLSQSNDSWNSAQRYLNKSAVSCKSSCFKQGILIKMPFSSGILKLLIAGRGCESSPGCWVDLWERFKPEWSFIPSVSLSSVRGALCYSPVLYLQYICTFVLVSFSCFPLPCLFSPCPRLGGSVDVTPVLLPIPDFPESTSFPHPFLSFHTTFLNTHLLIRVGLNCYHVPLDQLKSF